MSYEGSFTSETLIKFLEALIYKNGKRMTLILDGHPTHKTKKVEKWLETHTVQKKNGKSTPQIKLYYLPPYSPEVNPDEQVWKHARKEIQGRFSASASMLRSHVTKTLFTLQKKKELISSFFLHPDYL